MEEKCEIELTEGYHSINSRDVRLHIHKGKNAWVDQLYDKNIFRRDVLFSTYQNAGASSTTILYYNWSMVILIFWFWDIFKNSETK